MPLRTLLSVVLRTVVQMCETVAENPWVVLRVRTRHLRRAKENVRRQGAEFYSPVMRVRSARTREWTVLPLFPGYAFARHPAGQWVFLRGTFGVSEVLMRSEEQPAWLPDSEISRIRRREGPDGVVLLGGGEFERGARVRVEKGAVSLDAVVEGMPGPDRVVVLLRVLGGVRTEVAAKDVRRV